MHQHKSREQTNGTPPEIASDTVHHRTFGQTATVEPHRWGERVQWHQPRAAATPPYLLCRGESAVPHGYAQRVKANAGQDTPSACAGEKEKMTHCTRPTNVYGCSKNAPLLRHITAPMARFVACFSLNGWPEPRIVNLCCKKADIFLNASGSATSRSSVACVSGDIALSSPSMSAQSSACTNASNGETAQHRERGYESEGERRKRWRGSACAGRTRPSRRHVAPACAPDPDPDPAPTVEGVWHVMCQTETAEPTTEQAHLQTLQLGRCAAGANAMRTV